MKISLHRLLFITNLILLLASITALALTIIAYLKVYIFMESSPLMNRIFITLIVMEITVGVGSILGIVTRGRNKSLAVANIIKGALFAIGFLVVAVGSHFIPQIVLGNGDCNNSDLQWVAAGKKANSYSKLFCLSPLCYCDMNNYNGYTADDLATLDIVRPHRHLPNSYHNVQQCLPFILAMANDTYTLALTSTLGKIQQQFKCSGWCDYNEFSLVYVFSNVNNGKPHTKSCYPTISDYVYSVVHIGAGFSYFISILMLIIMALDISVLCKLKRNPQYRQFDDRNGSLIQSRLVQQR